MNVLVTGGAGYIGSHTCLALLKADMDIAIIDNLINSHYEAVERVMALAGRRFPFYEGDVCDEALLDKVFQAHPFDCVIHFAGLKAVGESVLQPVLYYRNNLGATLTLLDVMKRRGVHTLVFSSSATVYRSDSPSPLREAKSRVRQASACSRYRGSPVSACKFTQPTIAAPATVLISASGLSARTSRPI